MSCYHPLHKGLVLYFDKKYLWLLFTVDELYFFILFNFSTHSGQYGKLSVAWSAMLWAKSPSTLIILIFFCRTTSFMFSALMDLSLSATDKDFFLVERCLLQRYEQIHFWLAMFSMCF